MAEQQEPTNQPVTPQRKRSKPHFVPHSKPQAQIRLSALDIKLVNWATQRDPILTLNQILTVANQDADAPPPKGSPGRTPSGGWVVKKLRRIGLKGGDHELAVRLRHTGKRWCNIRNGYTFWDPYGGWDGSYEEITKEMELQLKTREEMKYLGRAQETDDDGGEEDEDDIMADGTADDPFIVQ